MKKKTKKQSENSVQNFASKVKAPQRLKTVGKRVRGIEPGTVAKGAAAISIAAGVVAAGVILSNKKNRQKAGKMAAKGIKVAREMAKEMGSEAKGKYQVIAQSVPVRSIKSKAKNIKRRKA